MGIIISHIAFFEVIKTQKLGRMQMSSINYFLDFLNIFG